MNVRIVGCEACRTEGRVLERDDWWDDRGGGFGTRDCGPCPYCEGTGGEIIAVEPIELDDLTTAYGV